MRRYMKLPLVLVAALVGLTAAWHPEALAQEPG